MSPLNSIGRKAVQAFDELGQAPAPRRVFQQPQDEPPQGFPYGSEWWMGYTVDGLEVTIHNIMLHYNLGAVLASPSTVAITLPAGGDTIVGFKLNFTTGVFTTVQTTDEAEFTQTGHADEYFRFPVYKFTVEGDPASVTMVTDYVHGSNIGGL